MNDFHLIENYFSNVLILFIKIIYPAYSTFKSIRNKDATDDTTWLIYWVVFAVLSFIETFFISFISWIPFFMICQILFYIWLQFPAFNGATIIFNNFIRPFFSGNENIISFLDSLKLVYKDLLSTVPQPVYDEDSSPSSGPNLNQSVK